MKQVFQNLRSGATELVETPCPAEQAGTVLIATRKSLISAGTERMLLEFGRANLIEKARQQPQRVRAVLDKMRTDGISVTLDAVRSKLDQPLALGYCNVGRVLAADPGIEGLRPGDRVVSNGPHAQVVRVPKNLCVKVPDQVEDEAAAFTVLAAVGLQGIRLAQPTLGEGFVVIGLGLVGLLTVQLLRAHGCRVLGIDLDAEKTRLAQAFGAEVVDPAVGQDAVAMARAFSRGRGVDGVLITASTKSSEIMHQAASMCRKRGRIILVGISGMELAREDFYEKELTFQVSCSYGPGRYDPAYEDNGADYPIGFVRWTEQRNFEAVLDMMAEGKVDPHPLISHRFPLSEIEAAYKVLSDSSAHSLGIVLEYPEESDETLRRRSVPTGPKDARPGASGGARPVCGVIGAGNYASRILIPALKAADAELRTLVGSGGPNPTHHGRKHGFANASTDSEDVFADPAVNVVFVVTRHDTHADLAAKALEAGKDVFVEKPLALTESELNEVETRYQQTTESRGAPPRLMIGFNRRFAPLVVEMKRLLDARPEPKSLILTVNAGPIPPDHWTQDPAIGGGRIIGEACHFVDLMRFLVGHPITEFCGLMMGASTAEPVRSDKASLTFGFADGSFGTVHYLSNGNNRFPKERVEVFCGGGILQLDNFRALNGIGWPGFGRMKSGRQDKGQEACAKAFLHAVSQGKPCPIPFEEIVEVSRATIRAANMLAGA